MTEGQIIGFDVPKIEAWLAEHTELRAPISWTQLAGGHSNLTYELTDIEDRRLVIRRPPQGQLLPKAHDMWREFRVLEALSSTDVPIAAPVAYCDDPRVADTHFYVMAKVDGTPMHTAADVVDRLDAAARRRASEGFIDVLATLHKVEPADVGLADLGRSDGYVERQLKTWYGSWTASARAAALDDPRVHELHDMLREHLPSPGASRIVHGDFGPHNLLFSAAGDVTAVLDWEIATLGDPLADFAYSITAWADPGDPRLEYIDIPTALPGFATRSELIARYAASTGADLSQLNFYLCFNQFKSACILHGVYARYRAGQKSSEGIDVVAMRSRILIFLDLATELAEDIS
ncbi:MAG: hypothetical protein JWM34_3281 [Ilumatobacteraceae bacterium]|nr:hypothetical protein [Ilumatobacteraceae bacterium]